MWSQWVWVRSNVRSSGWLSNSATSSRPRRRSPVPASRMIICPSARTSTHEVLPPYSTVIESDLKIHHKHIQFGAQENRISKYFDEKLYATLAVLDFGLGETQSAALV